MESSALKNQHLGHWVLQVQRPWGEAQKGGARRGGGQAVTAQALFRAAVQCCWVFAEPLHVIVFAFYENILLWKTEAKTGSVGKG